VNSDLVAAHISRHQQVMNLIAGQLAPKVVEAAGTIATALAAGHKVLVMGNGGSAADAQHLAAELVGRFLRERRALPAIALTTDTSILTAVGNDYGFDQIFSRQVEALASPGDVVIGISTSGRSANVLAALKSAQTAGCLTIGLLGRDGGDIAGMVDLPLVVPASETPHVQEAHVTLIHILCNLVEQSLFPSGA
jgi:D-sedoheptulose 7-phosphate isomerase